MIEAVCQATRRAGFSGPAWLLFTALLCCSQFVAAGIQVTPTRIDLDTDSRVAALRLENVTARDIDFQVELARWGQQEGENRYEPTDDLLATPPIFTLSAGEERILRVGLRRAPLDERELSYRLFIQELPEEAPEGFTGLRMVLRLGLPVFVKPAFGNAEYRLAWQLELHDNGDMQLIVNNAGNGHAQVSGLTLHAGDTRIQPGSMFYVLPGATQVIPIAGELSPGAKIELTARINGHDFNTQLQIE